MDQSQKNEILKLINKLDGLDVAPTAKSRTEGESLGLVKLIVAPLLKEEGYKTTPISGVQERGADLLAERPASEDFKACAIGISHKHVFAGQVGADAVHQALYGLTNAGFDRALVVVNGRFTKEAQEAATKAAPGTLELLDTNSLRSWVGRIEAESDIGKLRVEQVLKAMSHRFAKLIAESPRALDTMEWRDVERLVAAVFDGLGFDVTLTSGSKDEGKDVILEYRAKGQDLSYIIEIKHWRSGKGVPGKAVKHFLNVLLREKRAGGLFLSTYGFASNAFESLTEIERKKVRIGEESKIVSLCQTYLKIQSGILSPPTDLTEHIVTDSR